MTEVDRQPWQTENEQYECDSRGYVLHAGKKDAVEYAGYCLSDKG